MPVYDAYSAYYDLLYAGKDYTGEVDFIDGLIREFRPGSASVLDLGCGTGVHAWLLSDKGYQVTGIDRSSGMLDRARSRRPATGNSPRFEQGDLTAFRTTGEVDVVTSLFDVIGYLTDYEAVDRALQNIGASLRPGGLFLFDCWNGPAVHSQRPGTRLRKLENETIRLSRVASSDFDVRRNRIDVHYDVFVEQKDGVEITHLSETHQVRCYFEEELDLLLARRGFRRLFAMEWFTRRQPSVDSWSVLHGFVLDGAK